jgi:hypothetical protein
MLTDIEMNIEVMCNVWRGRLESGSRGGGVGSTPPLLLFFYIKKFRLKDTKVLAPT